MVKRHLVALCSRMISECFHAPSQCLVSTYISFACLFAIALTYKSKQRTQRLLVQQAMFLLFMSEPDVQCIARNMVDFLCVLSHGIAIIQRYYFQPTHFKDLGCCNMRSFKPYAYMSHMGIIAIAGGVRRTLVAHRTAGQQGPSILHPWHNS